ncbi:MAG: hypothetical protein QOD30_159, partial [Actinomycetota bacterium]|jgi:hypothetical protein|nr:hypothetical protein [Actinomycetota bacterium]
MRRTPLLVAVATLAIGGVAFAASRPATAPVGLLAAGGGGESTTTTEHHEPTTTTTVEHHVQATTTTVEHHEPEHPSTTTSTVEHHDEPTTTTIVERHEPEHPTTTTSTTSTTARPATGPIHLVCTTPHTNDLRVVCEWGDVPEHTAYIVVMREKTGPSQPIDRIDDPTVHRYVDETAEPGVTYSYRVSAYSADDTFLGTSNPVKVTPGPDAGGA